MKGMSHFDERKCRKVNGQRHTAVWGKDWESCEKQGRAEELGDETRTRETCAETL